LWKNYDTFHDLTDPGDRLQPEDTTTIYDATDSGNYDIDFTDYIGMTVHDADLQFTEDSINAMKTKIANANATYGCNIRIGAIDLDCEKWDTFYFNTEANLAGIANKFNVAQYLIASTVAGITDPSAYIDEIEGVSLTWYIKGGSFASYTPDGTSWDNFYAYDSRYHTQGMIETLGCASIYTSHNEVSVDRYLEAIEFNALNPSRSYTNIRNDAITTYFSLCMGYSPINFHGEADHRTYAYIDNPVIHSYKMGRKMAGENNISLPIEELHMYPSPFQPSYGIKENALEGWFPEQSWGYDPETQFIKTGDTPYTEDPSGGANTDFFDHWIEFVKGFNDIDEGINSIFNGETIEATDSGSYRFYIESADDEAIVNVDGIGYTIGSSDTSQFVWDSTGDIHTFTYEGESILRDLGSRTVVITYNGEGSHLFDLDTLGVYARMYKIVADLTNDAQERGTDIVYFVDKMATDLDSSEIPSTDIHREKLENQINSTSNVLTSNNIIYTTKMLDFVGELQGYTTDQYGSVDTFLEENSIKVKSTFADISEATGYPILPSNILGVS
jgi:hypothetical protein